MKTYGYFHILASALPRSVKIGIWDAQWLDLVGINLCAKHYQSILKVLTGMGIFTNYLTLASALPRSRKKVVFGKSFIWILPILIGIQKFINLPKYGWKPTAISLFSHVLLRRCLNKMTCTQCRFRSAWSDLPAKTNQVPRLHYFFLAQPNWAWFFFLIVNLKILTTAYLHIDSCLKRST